MHLKNLFLLLVFLVVYSSCKNSFSVQAPYKDETIVYGLLDQSDSVHYIRINKAFEGNGNAYVMAKQYDSLYYPVNEIKAVLKDSNPSTNTIVKIDALDTTTSVPLGPGVFSYPKQLLYYTRTKFNPNDYYSLVIVNTKTGKTVTGSTALIPDIGISISEYGKTLPMSFNKEYPSVIGWQTVPNVRIYQLTIRFYYDEFMNNTRNAKSLDWVFAPLTSSNLGGQEGLEYEYNAQGFCTLILNSIPYEAGATRYADSVGVIFSSGTDDLNTYVQLSEPSGSLTENIPFYSDLKNGVGLFTARHIQTLYKQVDGTVIDTLVYGPEFSKLNFQL